MKKTLIKYTNNLYNQKFKANYFNKISNLKRSIHYGNQEIKKNAKNVTLDPNHTHFILIDETANDVHDQDILFRSKLETEIRRCQFFENNLDSRASYKRPVSYQGSNCSSDDEGGGMVEEKIEIEKKINIPMILICVCGGADTLLVIVEALKQRVPLLVMAVFINLDLNYLC